MECVSTLLIFFLEFASRRMRISVIIKIIVGIFLNHIPDMKSIDRILLFSNKFKKCLPLMSD